MKGKLAQKSSKIMRKFLSEDEFENFEKKFPLHRYVEQ